MNPIAATNDGAPATGTGSLCVAQRAPTVWPGLPGKPYSSPIGSRVRHPSGEHHRPHEHATETVAGGADVYGDNGGQRKMCHTRSIAGAQKALHPQRRRMCQNDPLDLLPTVWFTETAAVAPRCTITMHGVSASSAPVAVVYGQPSFSSRFVSPFR